MVERLESAQEELVWTDPKINLYLTRIRLSPMDLSMNYRLLCYQRTRMIRMTRMRRCLPHILLHIIRHYPCIGRSPHRSRKLTTLRFSLLPHQHMQLRRTIHKSCKGLLQPRSSCFIPSYIAPNHTPAQSKMASSTKVENAL